ncbi:MAG TPA: VOC family protein [Candidatus Absconditabacterales bacterium]|nr:VOC family protein [Candidatus Absconditabacterales bacterium]HMT26982.1 VOC family protein [Candidatus Absconditabacterales bacterium]
MKIAPYLHFVGTAENALSFYKEIFHAELVMLQRYSETPEYPVDGEMGNRVMHAYIRRGENELMFSDVKGSDVAFGTNNYISINCTSDAEITDLYTKLSADAQKIGIALQDTFWGAKFAGFTDKFGVCWYLNWDKPKAA